MIVCSIGRHCNGKSDSTDQDSTYLLLRGESAQKQEWVYARQGHTRYGDNRSRLRTE